MKKYFVVDNNILFDNVVVEKEIKDGSLEEMLLEGVDGDKDMSKEEIVEWLKEKMKEEKDGSWRFDDEENGLLYCIMDVES